MRWKTMLLILMAVLVVGTPSRAWAGQNPAGEPRSATASNPSPDSREGAGSTSGLPPGSMPPNPMVDPAVDEAVVILDCTPLMGLVPERKLASWITNDILDALPEGLTTSFLAIGYAGASSASPEILPPTPLNWSHKCKVRRFLSTVGPVQQGGPAPVSALQFARNHLAGRPGTRPLVVLITTCDGSGGNDAGGLFKQMAQDFRASFHLVAITSDPDALARIESLDRMAAGRFHPVSALADVPGVVQGISPCLASFRAGHLKDGHLLAAQLQQPLPAAACGHESQLERLAAELGKSRQENARLTHQNEAIEHNLVERLKDIEILNSQTTDLKRKLQEQDNAFVNAKHHGDNCQQTIAQLQAANEKLVQIQKEQAAKAHEFIEKINTTQAALDEREAHVRQLKDKLAACDRCVNDLKCANDDLHSKLGTQIQCNEKLQNELKTCQQSVSAQFAKIQEQSHELTECCQEVERQKHARAQAAHEAERLGEENGRLKSELQNVNTFNQTLKTANVQLLEQVRCCEEKLNQTICLLKDKEQALAQERLLHCQETKFLEVLREKAYAEAIGATREMAANKHFPHAPYMVGHFPSINGDKSNDKANDPMNDPSAPALSTPISGPSPNGVSPTGPGGVAGGTGTGPGGVAGGTGTGPGTGPGGVAGGTGTGPGTTGPGGVAGGTGTGPGTTGPGGVAGGTGTGPGTTGPGGVAGGTATGPGTTGPGGVAGGTSSGGAAGGAGGTPGGGGSGGGLGGLLGGVLGGVL
jgi:hypothetical protein